MIESGLILTGSDAELLSRALSEVKTKAYEESEASLDNAQALASLLSNFRAAEKEAQERETSRAYRSHLGKRLFLGTRSRGKAVQMKSDCTSPASRTSLALAHFFHWSVRRGSVVCTRPRHIFSASPKSKNQSKNGNRVTSVDPRLTAPRHK